MAKILAVDDSRAQRQMLSHTLSGAGHTIKEAADGQEALSIANSEAFDLVITDVNMPRMDGLTFIKQMKANPKNKFTPVLVLTTETSNEKKMEGRSAGATGWIVKPFSPDKVLAAVKKVLG